MCDPQPWLAESLAIRQALADLHDRAQALIEEIPRRESTTFQRQAVEVAQRSFADAQGWLHQAEQALRSRHHLPEQVSQ